MSIPRVAALLGKTIESAGLDDWRRLVDAGTPEGFDLDFKKLYSVADPEFARKFATDVAAFANAMGGVIVVGVAEREGAAGEIVEVAFDESLELKMSQAVASLVFPKPNWRIKRVQNPTDSTKGLLLCVVPPSRLAPHAVLKDETLRYPVRRNARAEPLAEHEVAERYRQRFVRGTESEQRLQLVLREGLDGWRASSSHITAALVPLEPGELQLSASVVEQVRRLPRAPGGVLTNAGVVTGFRRLRLRDRSAVKRGTTEGFYGELHSDGAGVISVPLITYESETLLLVDQPSLVLLAGEALRELLRHAGGAGCVGDALLLLRIVLDTGTRARLRLAPLDHWLSWSSTDLMAPSGPLESRRTIVLQQSPHEDMQVLRSVLTDWVQSFGVPETDLIGADGTIDVGRWNAVVGEHPDASSARWGSFPPEVIRR